MLGGWDVSEFAVLASVITPVDVFHGHDLEVVQPATRSLVTHELCLNSELNASDIALSYEPTNATASASARRWA